MEDSCWFPVANTLYHRQKKDGVLFWYADIGWITGQTWTVYGSLITGGTSLFYDGILTYPTPDRWCKVIEKHSVSIFGMHRHQSDCS